MVKGQDATFIFYACERFIEIKRLNSERSHRTQPGSLAVPLPSFSSTYSSSSLSSFSFHSSSFFRLFLLSFLFCLLLTVSCHPRPSAFVRSHLLDFSKLLSYFSCPGIRGARDVSCRVFSLDGGTIDKMERKTSLLQVKFLHQHLRNFLKWHPSIKVPNLRIGRPRYWDASSNNSHHISVRFWVHVYKKHASMQSRI